MSHARRPCGGVARLACAGASWALACVASVAHGQADEAAPAPTVTLADALRLAIEASPALAATEERRTALSAEREALVIELLPDVRAAVALTAGFPGSASNLGARGMFGSPFSGPSLPAWRRAGRRPTSPEGSRRWPSAT